MATRLVALLSVALIGCGVPAPKSAPPSAEDAIASLRFDRGCGVATRSRALLALVTPSASFRGDASILAAHAQRLRLEIQSSFGVAILQLAADETLAAVNPRNRTFSEGPNDACTLHAWLGLPIAPDWLVTVLRGSIPVIAHTRSALAWDGDGAWSLEFEDGDLRETVRLQVPLSHRDRPWSEQALEVREATVRVGSRTLWHLEADRHEAAPRAAALVDPDGLDAPVEPSGPACDATLPRRVVIALPERHASLRLDLLDTQWNPPLTDASFRMAVPEGYRREGLRCVEITPAPGSVPPRP